jgi:hypothetical protein
MIRIGQRKEKLDTDIQDAYRRCFSSPAGRVVLSHLLTQLGFFDPGQSTDHLLMRNICVGILENIGSFHETNAADLTDALLALPVYNPEEGKRVRSDYFRRSKRDGSSSSGSAAAA